MASAAKKSRAREERADVRQPVVPAPAAPRRAGLLRRLLIGDPLSTADAHHQRLVKAVALAVFSSDALSSVAYATQEILVVFKEHQLTGPLAALAAMPLAVAISLLLVVLTVSYRQTIYAYPSGGGAYIVAKENLGTYAGLTAGAALLIDYILTVAVSVAAGVAAIDSAVPSLQKHRVLICIAVTIFITLANLRGVKESGRIFAVPTYAFIVVMISMIAIGVYKHVMGQAPAPALPSSSAVKALSWFLLARAFASGCAALTGVEAISNGVQAFQEPVSRNASVTLIWMSAILGSLFLAITTLCLWYPVHPSDTETVVSQLASGILGRGIPYYVVQASTALILVLAANTAFADFPRLASLLAVDRFLPRQLSNRGDRLVFSNGIIILAFTACVLIFVFKGNVDHLIPLYAVGVFLSFTLSQSGMVKHWWKERATDRMWAGRALLNGTGAVATLLTLLIIAVTKFTHGAWIVIILIPTLVVAFRGIRGHYDSVGTQLSLTDVPRAEKRHHTVIMPVASVHRGVVEALRYARSIGDDVNAITVDIDPRATAKLKHDWDEWGAGVTLHKLDSPYRSLIEPVMDYIDKVRNERPDDVITVILPEFIPARWWQNLMHNQSSLLLKAALAAKRNVVVTTVRLHLT
jgi:amino acid transporter